MKDGWWVIGFHGWKLKWDNFRIERHYHLSISNEENAELCLECIYFCQFLIRQRRSGENKDSKADFKAIQKINSRGSWFLTFIHSILLNSETEIYHFCIAKKPALFVYIKNVIRLKDVIWKGLTQVPLSFWSRISHCIGEVLVTRLML